MAQADKGTCTPTVAYAGNRRIGVECLDVLLRSGLPVTALLLPVGRHAEHAAEMRRMAGDVPILEGKAFANDEGLRLLAKVRPDYVVSIHFPHIFPPHVLRIPREGTLNLHPAYLPYNRGWHTATWAIVDGTPFGVTLHWVDAGLDSGAIALQRSLQVHPQDTAHTLYQRALTAERELFEAAIPHLLGRTLPRQPQEGEGSFHGKADIDRIRHLPLDGAAGGRDLLRILRALTTSRPEEAAFFEEGGRRYRVTVHVQEEGA